MLIICNMCGKKIAKLRKATKIKINDILLGGNIGN